MHLVISKLLDLCPCLFKQIGPNQPSIPNVGFFGAKIEDIRSDRTLLVRRKGRIRPQLQSV
jgi:hypothetical protein